MFSSQSRFMNMRGIKPSGGVGGVDQKAPRGLKRKARGSKPTKTAREEKLLLKRVARELARASFYRVRPSPGLAGVTDIRLWDRAVEALRRTQVGRPATRVTRRER